MREGKLGKQGGAPSKMRIFKREGEWSSCFPQCVAMVLHHLAKLYNTMARLGLKLVGYGGVKMMMEEEGNPQATMEA